MIRAVTAGDVGALAALIDATGLFPGEMLPGMAAGYLNDPAADEGWLTDDEGGPAGVAYFAPERMTSGTWNLLLIAVHPARQGSGRGTALLNEAERAVRARGGRMLLIETSGLPEFEAVRAFYRRRGYAEEARIRDFYALGDDKVVFRKLLT